MNLSILVPLTRCPQPGEKADQQGRRFFREQATFDGNVMV
jgi:hypothetical protein